MFGWVLLSGCGWREVLWMGLGVIEFYKTCRKVMGNRREGSIRVVTGPLTDSPAIVVGDGISHHLHFFCSIRMYHSGFYSAQI